MTNDWHNLGNNNHFPMIDNPIIFFGTEPELAVHPLERLIESGYNVAAVFTAPDRRSGRGHKLTPPQVKVVAKQHHIPVYQPEKSSEIFPILKNLPDTNNYIGILAGYGKIIRQSVLDFFEPYGIINIHPSLLPKYRGPSPIETAIADGENTFGVTLIKLVPAMDAGPIYAQLCLESHEDYCYPCYRDNGGTLLPEEWENQPHREPSKSEIYHFATTEATKELIGYELLRNIVANNGDYQTSSGESMIRPQDESQATFTQKLSKDLSILTPQTKSAHRLHDEVRAYLGFPKSKLTLMDTTCVITETHVADQPETALDQKCLDGKYLIIDTLIPEGRKPMSATDFLRGHTKS